MRYKWMFLVLIVAAAMLMACDGAREPELDVYETVIAEPEAEEYGPWAFANFADIRQPQHLAYYVPHGIIAVNHIEFMSDNLYGRSPFTYREKEAAAWLVEELLAMGHAWENIEVQEFTWEQVSDTRFARGMSWEMVASAVALGQRAPRETQISQNVILTVPGQTERKIIVGAHYDTFPYPGASDNASGTALLLESAQRMLNEDNYHTLVYVFFGAEEVGILGAHFYMYSLTEQERENLVVMVNADVLFEGPYLKYAAAVQVMNATRSWESHSEDDITRQVDEIAHLMHEAHGVEIIAAPGLVNSGSDHLPFFLAGYTVVFMAGMDNLGDGRWGTRVLHTPQDCIHYINERWPGKIDTNMRYFSIFLEEILLTRFE
ncbi:MAG: M28 family metallopeptidase [Defluviitaleaceae bacterium]|nr:M28 family metallopeptidase [Defluviitaleaceae bacterium]